VQHPIVPFEFDGREVHSIPFDVGGRGVRSARASAAARLPPVALFETLGEEAPAAERRLVVPGAVADVALVLRFPSPLTHGSTQQIVKP
jgi:hypothetical protein